MHSSLVAMGILLAAGLASAQVEIKEINPTNSDYDATDPNGASGGRMNGLASVNGDGNTFYAASEWGGLWKTTDQGVNWARLDGHFPNATWDVEVDPGTTSRVYATSFYDGRVKQLSGINVSNDSGATWTHPASSLPDPAFEGTGNDNTPDATFSCPNVNRTELSAFGIGVRADAPANVYVGTTCGVAISNDSGATWVFRDPTPLTQASRIWDVVVHDAGIVDVCGDDGHLRSIDGGTTWTQGAAIPAGRCSIAVSPDEAYVVLVLASDNQLYESDDAGATWNNLGTPDPTPQGRIPFVATNQRSDTAGPTNVFDTWFGDVELFRGSCTTPNPAMQQAAGSPRCPVAPAGWAGPLGKAQGAHQDMGAIIFDSYDTTTVADSCPRIVSSDGGVYRNTDNTADCQTPDWEQPTKTPRATWIYNMDGANQAGDGSEDLYFGLQDDGPWATTNAPANPPTWSNKDCCDVFDVVPDPARVIDTLCCFNAAPSTRMFLSGPGMAGRAQVAVGSHPPGNLRGFQFAPSIARFADKQYVAVTSTGVYVTADITAGPIVWSMPLGGAGQPPNACGVRVAVSGGTPTFYVQAGSCQGDAGEQLWSYTGVNPAGAWTQIDTNDGLTGGFNVWGVDPNDPNRLYASNVAPGGPQVVFSTDGGATWNNDAELDALMTAGGVFKYQNTLGPGPRGAIGFNGYVQPSLFAFDPENSNLIVAAGKDSGVFFSPNGGAGWVRLTDPLNLGDPAVPHIPRPRAAYFDHEPAGQIHIYIGTQGRGAWRLSFTEPNRDFCSYFVFAVRQARLKDMKMDSACNVGVDCGSPSDPADPCGSMGMEGAQLTGAQAVADRVLFAKTGTTLFQLFRNNPGPLTGVTLLNPPEQPWVTPIVPGTCGPECTPNLPALEGLCSFPNPFPLCDPTKPIVVRPGQDCAVDSVPANGQCDLPPGTYGSVRAQKNGRLVLGPGEYTFCSFRGSAHTRVVAAGATVNIASGPGKGAGRFRTGNDSVIGDKCGDLVVRVKGKGPVSFGRRTTVAAQMCAPSAPVHLGHANTLIGKFFGDRVFSDRGNTGFGCCGLP